MAERKHEFTTRRLLVRPYQPSDYTVWVQTHQALRPAQNRFDEGPLPTTELTRAAFRKMIKRHAEKRKKESVIVYAVFDRRSGRLIGQLIVGLVARFNVQSARVAYWIFNHNWRMGYGLEAVNGLVDHAFKNLKLHRLEAEIERGNRASLALARKAGFAREGVRRKAVFIHREWTDMVVYAIVAEDRGIKMRSSKGT